VLRLCIAFAAIILAYDVVAATAARLLWVTYESLLLPAAVLLLAMGLFAGRTVKSWRALSAIVVAAVAQSTLGWYVAALISTSFVVTWSFTSFLFTAFVSAIVSIVIGAIGIWVGLGVAGARREIL